MFFSVGTTLLVFYGLSFVVPNYSYFNISQKEYLTINEPAFPLLYNTLNILLSVAVAPIVEEFLFRGVILHRLYIKWGLNRAIIISSLLFGVHFDFIGVTIAGFFMAILYLKSKSLFVPIIANAFHNAIFEYLQYPSSDTENIPWNMAQYQAIVWVGILFFCVTLPFIISFLIKNWPKKDLKMPYFV